MQNKFYREGFNNASAGIPGALKFNQNYQGRVGIDFLVPELEMANREEYVKGYEAHYLQAFQGNPQIQLYFDYST